MAAFIYGVYLQMKLNIRDREILLTYYLVPFVFYLFVGSVFTSIIPDAYKTLIQSMSVFSVTMGGVIGAPAPLVELYGSEIKKAYRAGDVPLWTAALGQFISAFVHLFIMSMIIFITAPFLFKAVVPENLPGFFLALVLSIAASLSIGTIFGLFIKNTAKLGVVTQVVFLPSLMLSGIMFPASMLPKAFEYAGMIFPASWAYKSMCQSNLNFMTMLPLVFVIVLAFIISVWRLRKMKTE